VARVKISLVTPAPKRSLSGNRATAVRWARHLAALGHRVDIAEAYDDQDADLLIAVHAWRSAASVRRFRDRHPGRPVIVGLAGTDIYRFQHSHADETLGAMDLADRLVCLHERVDRDIPARFAAKLRVIHQSAPPLSRRLAPARRSFEVCVVGHLREEKDSLRTAYAARLLPADSRVRVIHLGRAHDEGWARAAADEMARNPRYRWRDEVPHWQVRRLMARARLMVLSSVMEGGANVISEAVVAGLPVIASRISGSVGLLGEDYAGYYPPEDEAALARLLSRAETDAGYLGLLERQCAARAELFRPEREREAWRRVLAGLARDRRIA
jgi:putative glycosyltransferase (TIGR04348 family)